MATLVTLLKGKEFTESIMVAKGKNTLVYNHPTRTMQF